MQRQRGRSGGQRLRAQHEARAGPRAHPGVLPTLARGFFAQGGLQLQVNVLDATVLRAARANPELHRDLVVRISGYSAYFVDLTEAMKDELIARACHAC